MPSLPSFRSVLLASFGFVTTLFVACDGTQTLQAVEPELDAARPTSGGDDGGGREDVAAVDGEVSRVSGSPGCSASQPGYPTGTTEAALTVGGVARTFRVHLPPSYEPAKPTPVVLLFHGGGGSAKQLQNQSAAMDPIADREGFVTVYADGTGSVQAWNAGDCCGKAAADEVDDVGFVAALLDEVGAKSCVDTRRVFATGMSNGALLSHRLACELSDRIAAIAPVAGTIAVDACAPTRPVPVFQIHGTEDGYIRWEGGQGCGPSSRGFDFTSVAATVDGWRVRNGCSLDTAPFFEQGNGSCAAYTGCSAPVVLCSVAGGGHSWPGGQPKTGTTDCPTDGPQSSTFVASEAIWKFFAANPMPL